LVLPDPPLVPAPWFSFSPRASLTIEDFFFFLKPFSRVKDPDLTIPIELELPLSRHPYASRNLLSFAFLFLLDVSPLNRLNLRSPPVAGALMTRSSLFRNFHHTSSPLRQFPRVPSPPPPTRTFHHQGWPLCRTVFFRVFLTFGLPPPPSPFKIRNLYWPVPILAPRFPPPQPRFRFF